MSLNKSSRSKSTVRSSEKEKKDDFLATYLPSPLACFEKGSREEKEEEEEEKEEGDA